MGRVLDEQVGHRRSLCAGDDMSYMIEVYLGEPLDVQRTAAIRLIRKVGGELTCEEAGEPGRSGACLTIEFATEREAESAGDALRAHGLHVEGPCSY